MNKDQVKGRAKQVAGKVKEVAGKVTGNVRTEAKGMAEKTAGKAQAVYGDTKEQIKKRRRRSRIYYTTPRGLDVHCLVAALNAISMRIKSRAKSPHL